MYGGYISVAHSHLGTGLFASIGTSLTLTADTVPQWVNVSGATEHMTQICAGLEDYAPAPASNKVKCVGGNLFPVAGYGRLRLLVNQGDGDFRGPTRELTLEYVAHVPNLGKYNTIFTKRLTQVFDEPMRVYAAAAVI